MTGMIEYKCDSHGIIHVIVGKMSWENTNIINNIDAILKAIPIKNIKSVVMASSMSPGIKIEI